MKSIKDLADRIVKNGDVADPKLVTVETQVRTGLMFPLPDWFDAPEEVEGSQSDRQRR